MTHGIEWLNNWPLPDGTFRKGETWNPIRGCSRVSEGCTNCYAEAMAGRFCGEGLPYEGLAKRTKNGARWTNEVRVIESKLEEPLRWKKPRVVFVNSMSDLFHEKVNSETITRVFAVMALCPQHIFIVLTKRPERMTRWTHMVQKTIDSGSDFIFSEMNAALVRTSRAAKHPNPQNACFGISWPLPNLILGVSVEDQKTANERIPLLLDTPAAARMISAEPLLGPVDLEKINAGPRVSINALDGWITQPDDSAGHFCHEFGPTNGVDWVICGGESGKGARRMEAFWARTLRDQCAEAEVPFFFKQWGEWVDVFHHPNPPEGEDHPMFYKLGKKEAGHDLDDKEHRGLPAIASEYQP